MSPTIKWDIIVPEKVVSMERKCKQYQFNTKIRYLIGVYTGCKNLEFRMQQFEQQISALSECVSHFEKNY